MESVFKVREGTMLVRLTGELDHHGAKNLISRMREELDYASPVKCVLDFSGITFMDSSGLAVILFVYRQMRQSGGTFSIVHLPEQAARVVDASGIERLISREEEDEE